MNAVTPIKILMVEDNPDDVLLAKEALRDSKVHCSLQVVEDGEDAMDFLFKRGEFEDAFSPDIILLDLNLPRKDGREVLKEIKDDTSLRMIPVVILTTSDDDDDIRHAYNSHVNCYIKKPVDFDQFIKVVQAINDFWFTVVRLPT